MPNPTTHTSSIAARLNLPSQVDQAVNRTIQLASKSLQKPGEEKQVLDLLTYRKQLLQNIVSLSTAWLTRAKQLITTGWILSLSLSAGLIGYGFYRLILNSSSPLPDAFGILGGLLLYTALFVLSAVPVTLLSIKAEQLKKQARLLSNPVIRQKIVAEFDLAVVKGLMGEKDK